MLRVNKPLQRLPNATAFQLAPCSAECAKFIQHKDMIDVLTASGANMMITMSAEVLRDFAYDIVQSVAEQMSALTIDSIKDAMGNSMKYCSTEETVVEYNIPLSTLNYGIAKGYIYPLKKGRKNVNSR